jgi:hypothetical protein
MRSKKWYAVAGGVAVVGITTAAMLAANGAGAQEPPFTIDPPDPGPDEEFEVSGFCGFGDEPGRRVDVFLTDFEPADVTEASENAIQQANVVPDQDDFTWSVTLRVPEEAEEGQTFFVSFACINGSFNFDSGSFGVGSPDLPTTTTTTTSPPPASGGSGGGSSAPGQATQPAQTGPAAPVEAEPTFTG